MIRRYGAFVLAAIFVALSGGGTLSTQGAWIDKAPMLAARYAHAAASLNGLIHAVGGADGSPCSTLTTHDVYDRNTNAWTPSAPMATGRSLPAAAVLNDGTKDLLYVVGGSTTCGARTATMEAYDAATNTWISKAPMPGGPRSSMGAAVIDNLLYVVGGIQFDAAEGVTALAEVYDPVTDTWSAIAPMPNARYSMAIGVIDGVLYVAGGGSTSAGFTAVEAYDPAAGTWSSKAPLPSPRAYVASAVANGLLYAIGGQNTSNLNSVEIYNPASNSWSAGPALPAARSVLPAAAVAGAIYVMGGGYDASGNLVAATYMLADTIAPTTTATPSIAPNANGWNNGDVTVTLNASDGAGGSGVQSIAYFLPGSNNVVNGDSAEVTITTEGITTLTYQATDAAGNLEPQKALTIRIDKTPPFLTNLPNLSASATSSAGAVVTFWISPWDSGSGISSTQVSPFVSGSVFPVGTTTETVTVIDAAGNTTIGNFDVTVNPARPFISVIGGTFTADGNPHPATATAVDQANNPVAGTFNISYLPGGSAPVAPGRYSATASFTSTDPAFTSVAPWTTMAPDPNAKRSPAVVEINGKLYVYGFDQDAGGNPTVPRLSIYDPWSNSWTIGASPNLVRAYVSVGAVNGKLYVAGGCVGTDCAVGTTNALEIYDPLSNTWSNGAAMPTARFGAAAGVIGGKLYVTGGTTACAPCVPSEATEIYDPATTTWTTGAPIPVSRELAAGASTNGRLYVIGGFQRDPGNSLLGGAVGTVHSYDPVANSWSTHASMPTPRHGAAAGVVFGTIYVVGGAAPQPTTVNERYDPGSDAWTPQVPMSVARHYVSGGVVNSTFYVIGGTNGIGVDANEAFETSLTTTITINPTDTTPPATTAIYPQANVNGYHRFNVSVFLNALDSGGTAPPAGVQSITYSLSGAQTGGGTVNSCCTSFTIVNEGTTTVTYYATDNLGNVEASQSFTVKLDKTAPSAANLSNITVNATSPAGAVVTFDLAPFDSFSGIDTITFNQGLPSGSTFPHGNTFQNIVITDKAGNSTFRSFSVTVNKTLVSINVLPATATISVGQGGQQFQAMGSFTDGSQQTLPSSSGGGGGGSGSGGSVWQLNFSPSLDVSPCGSVSGGLSSQAITPIGGVVNNSWGQGNVVQATGTLTLQQVNLTLACNPANGLTGSLNATWTGTRYEGTVTTFSGSTISVVITGWSAKAPMPTSRFSFGAAAVNGIVYAMGGGNPSQPQAVDAYDPSTNAWTTVSTMQTSREGAAAAALNGKIYVAGGNVAGGTPSGVFEAYDPALNSWTTLTSMPTPRAHLALVVAGGMLYAIGGDAGGPALAVVERYDPSTGQWTARASMSSARTFLVAGALNNGSTIVATGTASGTTELYDLAANSWTAGPSMLSSGGTPAAAVANNALWVIGIGSSGIGVQMFRPAGQLSAGWAVLGSMPTGRGQLAAAVVGDVVYALGGLASGGAVLSTLEAFSAPPPSNFFVSSGGGGGGGSSLPTVSWQSSNPSVAAISSSGFATGNSLGQTTIIASAGGVTCQPTGCAMLTVADTTPPNLFVPSQPLVGTATSAAGAIVNFASAVSAFDQVDGNITPSCTPSSGTLFPIGSTTVSCQAIDSHQNASPIKTFTVQVYDALTVNVPPGIVAEATSAAGAAVPFSVTATYFLGGSEPVECFIITGFVDGNPQIGPPVSSGATFPLGTTTVGCQATSADGQHEGNFFPITVQDTTSPAVTTSGNVTINANSAAGAVATFTASAVDLVGGATPVTCSPASGSTFAIGATTVTCTATDAAQNTGSATLIVTVLSPEQVITNLMTQAAALNFKPTPNLLQSALQSLATGNVSTACSQLSAFINQVQAQSGKSLTVADAAALIQSAMDAKAALGC